MKGSKINGGEAENLHVFVGGYDVPLNTAAEQSHVCANFLIQCVAIAQLHEFLELDVAIHTVLDIRYIVLQVLQYSLELRYNIHCAPDARRRFGVRHSRMTVLSVLPIPSLCSGATQSAYREPLLAKISASPSRPNNQSGEL